MPRNLQTRVTGDTATETPGARTTGLYGGAIARLRGYLGTMESGRLAALTGVSAYFSALEAADLLSSMAQAIPTVPIPTITNKYRFDQPLLHQRAHAEYETLKYTNKVTGIETVVSSVRQYFDAYHGEVGNGNLGGTTKATWGCGSDWYSLCIRSAWKWTNEGGDWLGMGGADGVPQGTTPWASSQTIPTAQPALATSREVSINVTDLVRFCDARSTWYAFFLKIVGTTEITLVGPLNTTLQPSTLEIVRNGVTEVHDLWYASVLVGPLAAQTTSQYQTMAFTATRPCAIEFHRPVDQSVQCDSATIKFRYASTAWGTNATVKVYKTNAFIPDMSLPVPGLASSYLLDEGLFNDPAVCAGFWVKDDTTVEDLLDVDWSGYSGYPWIPGATTQRTINQESLYDPTLWGTPGVDAHMLNVPMPTPQQMAQLLPHRNITANGTKMYGIAWNRAVFGGSSFVPYSSADLEAEGLPVLAPGLGALRLRYAEAGVNNGEYSYPSLTTGGGPFRSGTGANDLFMQFKRDKMGRVTDVYTRGYYMLGNGWDPNDDDFRYYAVWSSTDHPGTAGKYPEDLGNSPASAPWRVCDRSGKFPGGVQHITGSLPYQTYRRPKPNTNPIEWIYNTVGDTPVVKYTGGGGYSNTSGPFGYQGRWAFMQGFYKENHPGPACGGLVLNLEHYDFGNHNDCIPSQSYIKGWDGHWQSAPHLGGLGHLYPRKWYCVEHHWHMNSLVPYVEPPVGGEKLEAGFNVDGYDEWFVDGVFAGRTPLWAHRNSLMIDWALQVAMGMPLDNNQTDTNNNLRPITNVPWQEYMGAKEAIIQTYYGGQSACPRDMDIFMNGFVVSDGQYIGPMYGVSRANGGIPFPAIQITGTAWTPNRNGFGNVETTDIYGLPIGQPLTIAGASFGLILETPDLTSVKGGSSKDYLFAAWSGGIYVPSIDAVVCPGQGGHGDSAMNDNAVLAFKLSQMNWSRLKDRSPTTRVYNGTAWVDGAVSGASEGFPLADGSPSCQHNFFGCEWVPGAAVGNAKGMVYRPGYTSGLFDLDTNSWKPLHYLYGTSRSASNSMFMRTSSGQLWGVQETPHQFQRFDPTATVTGPAGASYGNYTTTFSNGGSWSYDRQICIKVHSRDELVTIGRPVDGSASVEVKRFRLGQAVAALGSGGDIAPYIDTITMTGPDVADLMSNPEWFADSLAVPGVSGRWCHALGVDDPDRSRLLIWGNFVGDCVYAITGLSTNTWTVTKIAGTGALSSRYGSGRIGHGPYGRGALWKHGSAFGLVSLGADYSEDPTILRLG